MTITSEIIDLSISEIRFEYKDRELNDIDKYGRSPITEFCKSKRENGWSEEDIRKFIDELVKEKTDLEKISYYAQANQDEAVQSIVDQEPDPDPDLKAKYISCAFQNYFRTNNSDRVDQYIEMLKGTDNRLVVNTVVGNCAKNGQHDLVDKFYNILGNSVLNAIVGMYAIACNHGKVVEYLKRDSGSVGMAIMSYGMANDIDKSIGIRNIILSHHHAIILDQGSDLVVCLKQQRISPQDIATGRSRMGVDPYCAFLGETKPIAIKVIEEKQKYFPTAESQQILQDHSYLLSAQKDDGSYFSIKEISEMLKTKSVLSGVAWSFVKSFSASNKIPEDIVRNKILGYLLANPSLIEKSVDERTQSFSEEFSRNLRRVFAQKHGIFGKPETTLQPQSITATKSTVANSKS